MAIILPLIEALGFNLTWFAILVAVNLQTAWLSPPVALSAYVLIGGLVFLNNWIIRSETSNALGKIFAKNFYLK